MPHTRPKIVVENLEFKDGDLVIKGAKEYTDALQGAIDNIRGGLRETVKQLPPTDVNTLNKELRNIGVKGKLKKEIADGALFNVIEGDLAALGPESAAQKEMMTAIESFLEKHAQGKYAALQGVSKRNLPKLQVFYTEAEALLGQVAAGKVDLSKIAGHTAENEAEIKAAAAKMKSALQDHVTIIEQKIKGPVPAVPAPGKGKKSKSPNEAAETAEKEEVFWARQVTKAKNTLGSEAWEKAPVKTAFRTGGVLVGLGAIIDAIFRSKTTDSDGAEVDRSGATRVIQAVAGAGIASGSALIGGRK
jgi:hypothetical protein